jgi:hypothetical protein
MQDPDQPPAAPAADPHAAGAAAHSTPRSDFIGALAWIVFGVAVTVGSWNMDRLEKQDINPYTVPGLVPGLLGVAVVFFGLLMLARAWRQGALTPAGRGGEERIHPAQGKRFAIVLALCLILDVVLLGHGLPFWAAAALYVTATIAILQYPERKANGQVARGLMVAAATGIAAGVIITLVFQEFFLVRLP